MSLILKYTIWAIKELVVCGACLVFTWKKKPNKFQLMQDTHPQIYDYCINKLGCGKVMDYCGIKYKKEEECEQQELITLE